MGLATWPIQPIGFSKWQNNFSSAFTSDGKIDTALFGNAKNLCLFCLMRQKHCWTYSILRSTNRIWLKAKYLQYCFCLKRQNINIYFAWADQDWIGPMIFTNLADQDGIGFNFVGSGLDRIQFFGSGLDSDWKISESAHLCCLMPKPLRDEIPTNMVATSKTSINFYAFD